jgi:hypothetical protein
MANRDRALIDFLLVCLMPTDEWEAYETEQEKPDDPDNWREYDEE